MTLQGIFESESDDLQCLHIRDSAQREVDDARHTTCSIHGCSGAFRDCYNLNHLNGLLNSLAWMWRGAASAQTSLARAIQATHAAGQQASTSPAQRASSGTRPGGRTAILATLRPAGVTEQRVQQPKAWTAARRKPPIALLRRRRRPAPSAPCIPHAPKTLRNRALPIFGEVPADCTNHKSKL